MIFRFASLRRVPANTFLQELDGPPAACFVITAGSVGLRVRRPNGGIREIDRFGPGDMVGFLAMADSQPSPYEIIAFTSVEAVAFEADVLAQHIAARHPEALAAVSVWTPLLNAHLRATLERSAKLAATRRPRPQSTVDDAWKGSK